MAAVSNIIAAGFGSWSSIEYVPTIGFGIGEAAASYTPVVHYHTLEGPSKQIHSLVGPSAAYHTLEGPSKQIRILKGG